MHWDRLRRSFFLAGVLSAGVLIGMAFRSIRPVEAIAQDGGGKEAPRTEVRGSADEQAIRKAAGDYIAAMNKGDLDGIMAFWAQDAEYVDESGKVTRGKEAIGKMFKTALPELKGHKISGREHSIRTLRPDVGLEDGSIEFCGPDGCKEFNRYAVVWMKSEGKWLISSARDLPADVTEAPSLAYPRLQALEWLVGEWSDESPRADVKLTCRWGPNKSCLLLDYDVKHEGGDPLQVTVRVGWDPIGEMIRSWVFDSEGGFGEGEWHKDGLRWVVDTAGVLPDGGTGRAIHVWEFTDPQHFVWRATDREVDGQPVGSMEVKFVRKSGK